MILYIYIFNHNYLSVNCDLRTGLNFYAIGLIEVLYIFI